VEAPIQTVLRNGTHFPFIGIVLTGFPHEFDTLQTHLFHETVYLFMVYEMPQFLDFLCDALVPITLFKLEEKLIDQFF